MSPTPPPSLLGLAGHAWQTYTRADPTQALTVAKHALDLLRASTDATPATRSALDKVATAIAENQDTIRTSAVVVTRLIGAATSTTAAVTTPMGLLTLGANMSGLTRIAALDTAPTAVHHQLDALKALSQRQVQLLEALSTDLHDTRQELRQGFAALHTALDQQQARVYADTFRAHMRRVLWSYGDLLEEQATAQRPVDPTQLTRVAHATDDLIGWTIDARARHNTPGDPVRLPFLVAEALALRIAADIQLVQRGSVRQRTRSGLQHLHAIVDQELLALVQDATLYQLAIERPAHIQQLVHLRRALRSANHTQHLLDHTLHSPPNPWSDGLDALRNLFQPPDGPPRPIQATHLPLRTIDDFRWYLEWQGLPAHTDIRDIGHIDLSVVCRQLGAPAVPAFNAPSQLTELLQVALPAYRRAIAHRFRAELDRPDLPLRLTTPEAPPTHARLQLHPTTVPLDIQTPIQLLTWDRATHSLAPCSPNTAPDLAVVSACGRSVLIGLGVDLLTIAANDTPTRRSVVPLDHPHRLALHDPTANTTVPFTLAEAPSPSPAPAPIAPTVRAFFTIPRPTDSPVHLSPDPTSTRLVQAIHQYGEGLTASSVLAHGLPSRRTSGKVGWLLTDSELRARHSLAGLRTYVDRIRVADIQHIRLSAKNAALYINGEEVEGATHARRLAWLLAMTTGSTLELPT